MKFGNLLRAGVMAGAAACLCGAAVGFAPAPRAPVAVFAAAAGEVDKITLKDGKVIEGKITKEVDGYIWFEETIGAVKNERFLKPDEIASIERAAKPADAVKAADPKKDPKARKSGTPRIAMLTMEETVGIQMCAKPLEDAIPLLEEEGVEIVVFRVNSDGGSVLETGFISDVIHNKFKPKFTVAAWIDTAISGGALSAHCIENIYFMPNGKYGGATAWSGGGTAVKGRSLEEILVMAEKFSARGGHNKAIMRAMQVPGGGDEAASALEISPPAGDLSCDISENGDVTWRQDVKGKYVLNPQGEIKILTFNSDQAYQFKFAKGIAKDIDELAKAMGYQEVEWVGEKRPGTLWPVCKAEDLQIKWRKDVTEAHNNMQTYFNDYGRQIQDAQAASDRQKRGVWLNKAKQSLNFLRNIVKKYPSFQYGSAPPKEWFDQQDELIRRLSRP